jgi:hypothetical protein
MLHPIKLTPLIILTVIVIIAVLASIAFVDNEALSAYGSVIGGAGSILAVIWFSASLWYQSIQLEEQGKQLKEQREHFAREFSHLQEAGRRDAILIVKGILDDAEQQAIKQNGSIKTISELLPIYAKFDECGIIINSDDVDTVAAAVTSWMKKEAPALTLMKGIRSAAEVYFRARGIDSIDYSKTPEEFVDTYGSQFWGVPYFSSLAGTAAMLAKFMMTLQPGRAAAQIAILGVTLRWGGTAGVNMDKVLEDLKDHCEKNYPVPKIMIQYNVPTC